QSATGQCPARSHDRSWHHAPRCPDCERRTSAAQGRGRHASRLQQPQRLSPGHCESKRSGEGLETTYARPRLEGALIIRPFFARTISGSESFLCRLDALSLLAFRSFRVSAPATGPALNVF